jgi:hypothetical protein
MRSARRLFSITGLVTASPHDDHYIERRYLDSTTELRFTVAA